LIANRLHPLHLIHPPYVAELTDVLSANAEKGVTTDNINAVVTELKAIFLTS
jgi:hypothetical protein